MLSILKLSWLLYQQCIKIVLKNLQESNWDEATKEQKLDVYKFRIDVLKGMMSINAEKFFLLYLY